MKVIHCLNVPRNPGAALINFYRKLLSAEVADEIIQPDIPADFSNTAAAVSINTADTAIGAP
jgi:hypothetical protein